MVWHFWIETAFTGLHIRGRTYCPGATTALISGECRLEWVAVNSIIVIMERRIFAHLSRTLLRGIAHVLGSLGIFFFFGSCRGAGVAVEAILCLGIATIIILACAEQD
jgi:hypothetical protein